MVSCPIPTGFTVTTHKHVKHFTLQTMVFLSQAINHTSHWSHFDVFILRKVMGFGIFEIIKGPVVHACMPNIVVCHALQINKFSLEASYMVGKFSRH